MKLDLMSGVVSKYGVDWIAYDSQAQIGIKDDVTSIKKYFLPNSVKEIVVDNPQAEFIELLKDLLIVKGEVTIRGHFSNPFFKMIYRHFSSSLSGRMQLFLRRSTKISTFLAIPITLFK